MADRFQPALLPQKSVKTLMYSIYCQVVRRLRDSWPVHFVFGYWLARKRRCNGISITSAPVRWLRGMAGQFVDTARGYGVVVVMAQCRMLNAAWISR